VKKLAGLALVAFVLALVPSSIQAQEDKPLLDLNKATAAELTALPHMTPARVTAITGKRPFADIVEFNTFALAQGLTAEQLTEVYGQAFIPVKLNTGTREQILLIPGAGNRMVREFGEYRPWKTKAQFEKEIGKYVGDKETARLWKYVVIDPQ
jgi:DNA uptake protein ComE-like DNA-binding protein